MPEPQTDSVLAAIDDTLAILRQDDDERRIAKIFRISAEAEEATKPYSMKAASLTQGMSA
jgi:hypothetical protein